MSFTNKEILQSAIYKSPVLIKSDVGSRDLLGDLLLGRSTILITTEGARRRRWLNEIISQIGSNLIGIRDDVISNPDISYFDKYSRRQNKADIELIVAFGGGSCIDTAKVISIIEATKEPYSIKDLLKVNLSDITSKTIPIIAIPTTAGTGSEVTPFATIWDHNKMVKYSIDSPLLYPEAAILDAELTIESPQWITLASGLDAFSHSLESIWNIYATPETLTFSNHAFLLLFESLQNILRYPSDLTLRIKIQEASLLAGIAISLTRTSIAHAISYPFTLRYGISHGLACSFTLPSIYQYLLSELSLQNRLRIFTETTKATDDKLLVSAIREFIIELYEYVPKKIFSNIKIDDELLMSILDSPRTKTSLSIPSLSELNKIVYDSLQMIK